MKFIIFSITIFLSIPDCIAHKVEWAVKETQKITSTVESKQEVIRYFDDYMQHYNDYLSDPHNTAVLKSMADNYHLPAFQVIPTIPLKVLNSSENIAKGSQNFLDSLIAQGVASIKWESIHIEMLTKTTAYASNIGIRYKTNGEAFNKAAADFIVLKTENEWKIATLILRSPEPFNNLKIKREVSDFFALYLKNYNRAMADDDPIPHLLAASEDLNIPAINISQKGEFLMLESNQQIGANTKGFIFQLKAQGASDINYDKTQIKLLTETSAIVSNVASINKIDGTALMKIGVTYIVNKTVTGWKIILRTIHAPNNILNIK